MSLSPSSVTTISFISDHHDPDHSALRVFASPPWSSVLRSVRGVPTVCIPYPPGSILRSGD